MTRTDFHEAIESFIAWELAIDGFFQSARIETSNTELGQPFRANILLTTTLGGFKFKIPIIEGPEEVELYINAVLTTIQPIDALIPLTIAGIWCFLCHQSLSRLAEIKEGSRGAV
ncbi:hypothetical protein KAI46_02880 [bacterium]|nr:hypothetical protein [bacterium]